MADILFTNFAHSRLAAGINASATTVLVEAGHGARFPDPAGGDFFYVTLESAAAVREIVKVTARVGDTFTVVRGQDNTTALDWAAGVVVALRLNAAAIEYVLNQAGATYTKPEMDALLDEKTSAEDVATAVAGATKVPKSGDTKTASYTLALTDAGKYIEVGSGGGLVIANGVFSSGDVVTMFNNTASNVTVTCSIDTAYVSGVSADRASVVILPRGLCTALFTSGSECVISGSVT